jgi:hypothetical protein
VHVIAPSPSPSSSFANHYASTNGDFAVDYPTQFTATSLDATGQATGYAGVSFVDASKCYCEFDIYYLTVPQSALSTTTSQGLLSDEYQQGVLNGLGQPPPGLTTTTISSASETFKGYPALMAVTSITGPTSAWEQQDEPTPPGGGYTWYWLLVLRGSTLYVADGYGDMIVTPSPSISLSPYVTQSIFETFVNSLSFST